MNSRPVKPLADEAQRSQATRELDTTFLVEAAAGTGKTTILVERVLSILAAGRASLREIVAITFTEKAAGDLKIRLRQTLEEALRERGAKAPQGLRQALLDLEAMSVNTIHSFCADLIRQRPVEAGVEPGFAVADELGASLILEEAWESWLAGQMAGDAPAIRRAIESGIAVESAGRRDSPIFGLASNLIERRDALTSGLVETPWTDAQFIEAAATLRAQVAALAEMRASDCAKPEADGCAIQIAALETWIACSAPVRASEEAPDGATTNLPDFDAVRAWLGAAPAIKVQAGQQGNWSSKAALQAAKSACAQVKEQIASALGEAGHRVLADLVEWLRPFLEEYGKAKERRHALDFSDLLLKARDMLRDSRPARDHFKRAFRCILVDEFQDTDPLQTEIVFFLSERLDAHAADWESAGLVPGKLFIVGDPKQSIYRFRRADLDLYGRVRAAIARQGATLQLSVNFRTVPRITSELNPLFEPLMAGPVGERFEPKHVALSPYRDDEETRPCVLMALPPEKLGDERLNADGWRRKESGCIAALIRQLVESHRTISAGKSGGRKPIAYRDIAVLYRASTGLDALEDALRAHEVPYQVAGGRHYYARMEFQDLLSVLKAVDNPYDGLSVVGALRSPFFGHSDEDLLRHFAAGGTFNYLADVPAGFAELAEAFDALKELHERRRTEPAPAVLAALFESTRALQIYAMKPHGEQRVANLLKLQDIARALANAEVASFGALVRWLSEMESSRQAEAESPLAEADEDFVQVMTFHKAKGLEFPVVVLAHLGSEGAGGESMLLDRARGKLHVNLGRDKKTRGWDAAMAGEEDRAEHERRRMFYVAATRARDLLVLPAYWAEKPDAGFLKYLNERYPPEAKPCEGSYKPSQGWPGVEIVATDSFDLDKRSRDTLRLKPVLTDHLPPEAIEAVKHRKEWQARISAEAQKLSSGRNILTASGQVADTHASATSPGSGEGNRRAKDFGTLVHRLMEIVDFRSPGDLTALAEAEARGLGLTSADAREAVALVRKALSLPLLAERAAKAEEVYREVPFAFMEGGALYEGYADLVFVEKDSSVVIVDYKTDSVTAAEAPERAIRYAPQAQTYMHAISLAVGKPVAEFYFLFFRPGVAVRIAPSTN